MLAISDESDSMDGKTCLTARQVATISGAADQIGPKYPVFSLFPIGLVLNTQYLGCR
jgi:hypothetical protein